MASQTKRGSELSSEQVALNYHTRNVVAPGNLIGELLVEPGLDSELMREEYPEVLSRGVDSRSQYNLVMHDLIFVCLE